MNGRIVHPGDVVLPERDVVELTAMLARTDAALDDPESDMVATRGELVVLAGFLRAALRAAGGAR